VRIAVNVSPLQLRSRGFVAEIKQAIDDDAHAASGLELEITESLIMEDVRHTIASLQAIRAMGVTIAIDDFGTGFFVTQSLVQAAGGRPEDRPLVRDRSHCHAGGIGARVHHH